MRFFVLALVLLGCGPQENLLRVRTAELNSKVRMISALQEEMDEMSLLLIERTQALIDKNTALIECRVQVLECERATRK